MIPGIIRLSGLGGVVAMMAVPDPGPLALWGVVITTIGGVVAQIITARETRLKDAQKHQFELEDRAQQQAFRTATSASLAESRVTLNSAAAEMINGIYRVETKADVAYDTANHVNAKIANIAKAALTERQKVEDKNVHLIRQDIHDLFRRHLPTVTPAADEIKPPAPDPSNTGA